MDVGTTPCWVDDILALAIRGVVHPLYTYYWSIHLSDITQPWKYSGIYVLVILFCGVQLSSPSPNLVGPRLGTWPGVDSLLVDIRSFIGPPGKLSAYLSAYQPGNQCWWVAITEAVESVI